MPHWYVSEVSFILHPSGTKFVMNATGFKFISNETKRFTQWAVNLSTKMIKTCLKVQFNAAVLPVYFMYGGIKFIYQFYNSESEIQQPPEPSSDSVVRYTKNARNSFLSVFSKSTGSSTLNTNINSTASNGDLVNEQQSGSLDSTDFARQELATVRNSTGNPKVKSLSVNEFSGSGDMWDVEIIGNKGKYFSDSFIGKEEAKLAVAKRALEQHPNKSEMPKTREEFAKLLDEARHGLECSMSSDSESVGYQSTNTVDSNASENFTTTQSFEIISEQRQALNDESNQYCTHCSCNIFSRQIREMHDDIMRLSCTHREIQETGSSILERLCHLNYNLTAIISQQENLRDLEFQRDNLQTLLSEVLQDRTTLQNKLATLENLISEEQSYLSDISSYESGFYESENARISGQQ